MNDTLKDVIACQTLVLHYSIGEKDLLMLDYDAHLMEGEVY